MRRKTCSLRKIVACFFMVGVIASMGCDTAKHDVSSQTEAATETYTEDIYGELADNEQERVYYQNYLKHDATAGTEEYYYIVNSQLHSYNTKTGVEKVLCHKKGCTHGYSDAECGAYVTTRDKVNWGEAGKSYNCMGKMLFWHNDGLYVIESDETSDYLVKYDSEHKAVQQKWNLVDEINERYCAGFSTEGAAILVGDYLYYMSAVSGKDKTEDYYAANNYNTDNQFNRIKLEAGAKPETLGKIDISIYTGECDTAIRTSGQYIYVFSEGKENGILQSNNGWYWCRVCRYDTVGGTFETLYSVQHNFGHLNLDNGVALDVSFDDNLCMDDKGNAYMLSSVNQQAQIYKLSFDNGFKAECVYSPQNKDVTLESMYFDGSNFYVFEQFADLEKGYHRIIKLDKNGVPVISMELQYDDAYMAAMVGGDTWSDRTAKYWKMYVEIVGGDEDRLIIKTYTYGIKGLTHDDKGIKLDGRNDSERFDTYAMGIIKKSTFGNEGAGITRIYQVK